MRYILRQFISIICVSTFLCQQVCWANPHEFRSLRALSLIEGKRQLTKGHAASAVWGNWLAISDNEFLARMGQLRRDVDGVYFGVLNDMGFVDRFRQRYEAGSLAIRSQPSGYVYHPKLGAARDIRAAVNVVLKSVGLDDPAEARTFLQDLQAAKAGTVQNPAEFHFLVQSSLQALGKDSLGIDESEWATLASNCGKIRPWLDLHLGLTSYEQGFVEGHQGKGLSLDTTTYTQAAVKLGLMATSQTKRMTQAMTSDVGLSKELYEEVTGRDYNQFLRTVFWVLVFDCKLGRQHFEDEAGYKKFISSLFAEKFSRGEINEVYFGEDEAGIAQTRTAIATEVQKRLNKRYGVSIGNVLPLDILEMYGVPHPVIHWFADRDTYITHVYDPLYHSLTAAGRVATHRFKNRKCLRLAMLLHDVSKARLGMNLEGHPEKSAEMVDEVLEDWGLAPELTDEEKTLIKILVKTHADFHSVRPDIPRKDPLQIAERFKPPANLAPYVDQMTLLCMHRRIIGADVTSIPGVVRQGIAPGQLNSVALEENIRASVIPGHLRRSHSRVFSQILRSEFQRDETWMKPVHEWLGGKGTSFRAGFFQRLGWELADLSVDPAALQERILGNAANEIGPEQEANCIAFLDAAFHRFAEFQERVLPSVPAQVGASHAEPLGPFNESLTYIASQYGLPEPDRVFIESLSQQVTTAVEAVVQEEIAPSCSAVPVGSTQRATFIVRNRSYRVPTDVDFDCRVLVPEDVDLPNLSEIEMRVAKKIRDRLLNMGELYMFLIRYKAQRRVTLDFKVAQPPGQPDTYLIRIVYNNVGFVVDVAISKALAIQEVGYNSKLRTQLDSMPLGLGGEYRMNVRLTKDFIRRHLGIKKGPTGCLAKGHVIEQLVMQTGRCLEGDWLRVVEPGSFEKVMEFMYAHSFTAEGRLRDFDTVKHELWIKDITGTDRNILADLTEDEWRALALASRRFNTFKQRDTHWSLPSLAGKPTIPRQEIEIHRTRDTRRVTRESI